MSFKVLQLRRATAAAWTSADPTLAEGEIGYETDTGKYKIGDGTTAWTSLAYFNKGGVLTYAALSALDGDTDVSGAELEELTDGSETTLHSHSYVDFVDRGNLTAVDFDLGDLTADGKWQNLFLSAIVPAGTKAVKLRVSVNCTDYTTNNYIKFRKNGNTDTTYNVQVWKAFVNNLAITTEVIVFCDANRIIEYAIINTLTQCDITVCGWII